MAKKISAGLVLYRRRGELEVFLVHPGGPFWAKKDTGAWSVPKGEIGAGEDSLQAAKREFTEETGFPIDGEFRLLEPLKQPGGKIVHAWAIEADCDPSQLRSNLFSLRVAAKVRTDARVPGGRSSGLVHDLGRPGRRSLRAKSDLSIRSSVSWTTGWRSHEQILAPAIDSCCCHL